MAFDWVGLLHFLGALGLFLFGMKIMSEALVELAGPRMRSFMMGLIANRFTGVATGIVTTALVQSSSTTTLMVVTFVNAGLLKLAGAISVIMGANIGTTLNAWLITLLGFKVKISALALPLMILAFAFYVQRSPLWNRLGGFIAGFAILFIGLDFMKASVPDLQNSPELYQTIRQLSDMGFASILVFVFVGTLLTLLLQSSSATLAITLVAASQGWLPFPAAAAMVLGENIGTTITANMAAMVANTNARRAALAHLLFNLFGVLWVLALFVPVLELINSIAATQGAEPLSQVEDIPIGLAIFHSFFNIANMLLLLGFVDLLARVVKRLLKKEQTSPDISGEPFFLDKKFLKYPETGIEALLKESRRLYDHAIFKILAHGMYLHRDDIVSDLPAEKVVAKSREVTDLNLDYFVEKRIQPIYTAMIEFGNKLQQRRTSLSKGQLSQLADIKHANRDTLIIVSNIASLNADLKYYADSENQMIHYQYDRLRALLVTTLRRMVEATVLEKTSQRNNALDALYRDVKKHDRKLMAELDDLIRDQKISPEMGARLISSSATMKRLGRDLIRVARRLYVFAEEKRGGEFDDKKDLRLTKDS